MKQSKDEKFYTTNQVGVLLEDFIAQLRILSQKLDDLRNQMNQGFKGMNERFDKLDERLNVL